MNELDPHFISIVKARIHSALTRLPHEDWQAFHDMCDGKEVVIEQQIEHGKIVCRFTPMTAVEMIRRELVRESSHTLRVVYQSGLAQRQAREEKPTKDIKTGRNSLTST